MRVMYSAPGGGKRGRAARSSLLDYFLQTLGRQFTLKLKGAGAEQEIDDVALVRLQPVELDRRDRPEVQPVDVRRIDELPLPFLVVGDDAAHQRRPDRLQHLLLR